MMAFLPVFLLVALTVRFLPASYGQTVANVTHETFLDTSKNVFIRWSFNATHIDLEMTGRTLGWLAVGISPNGGMDQSDVFMGWVDDRTRRPVIQDRWNNAPSLSSINLILDAHQDWILTSGSQNESHTSIRAVRKLTTCDFQDRPITSDTLRLIYAMNPSDPRTPTSIVKHTFRGTRSVLLLSEAFRVNPSAMIDSDPSTQELDLLVNQVAISAGARTIYHCSLIKLPPVDQKYHIVGIKPTVTAGNEGIVHHLLAYICNNKIDDRFPSKDFDCSFSDRPNPLRDMVMANCTTILGVFGIGSDTYYFPPEAGLPLTPDMGEKYVFLEMHYDNPNGLSVTDSSGITLIVTSNLRPNDAAITQMGSTDVNFKMMIPPNQDDFTIYSHCSQNCTSAYFPRAGINIINVFLHTHLLGRKVYLRQIRNKREMSPIKDESYDFNYQESQRLSPPRVILPGDDLIVECHFSSTERRSVTFGGWGSPEEMCMAFVTYYPATTAMSYCSSQADTASLLKLTNYPQSNTFREDRSSDVEAYKTYVTSRFPWTAANVAKLQNYYKTANYQAYCTAGTSIFYKPLPSFNYTAYVADEVCRNPNANSADQNSRRPVPVSMIMSGTSSTSNHGAMEPDHGTMDSHAPMSSADHGVQGHSDTSNNVHVVSRAVSSDDPNSPYTSNGDESVSVDHSDGTDSQSDHTSHADSDGSLSSGVTSMNSSASFIMGGNDPVSAVFDMLKGKWMAFLAMLGGFVQSVQTSSAASS